MPCKTINEALYSLQTPVFSAATQAVPQAVDLPWKGTDSALQQGPKRQVA
jgi:hypothetical protein